MTFIESYMTAYIRSSNVIRVFPDDQIDVHKKLKPEIYMIKLDKILGYFLETVESGLQIPEKIYGSTERNADRIINTFKRKSSGTGVLLEGLKGSGKTLTTKLISHKLITDGIPTIIVANEFVDDTFIKLIKDINQECVIIFDEFEKVYEKENQQSLLSLLDGLFNSKKLFLFTVNDTYKLDSFLLNRTGRIHYRFSFKGLEEDFVLEYCQENLNNKSEIQKVLNLVKMYDTFSFDNLQSLVWEMNTYNEAANIAIENLNVEDVSSSHQYDIIYMAHNGKEIKRENRDGRVWHLDPFSSGSFYVDINYKNNSDSKEESNQPVESSDNSERECEFSFKDIKKCDLSIGQIEYENNEGYYLIIKKQENINIARSTLLGAF